MENSYNRGKIREILIEREFYGFITCELRFKKEINKRVKFIFGYSGYSGF